MIIIGFDLKLAAVLSKQTHTIFLFDNFFSVIQFTANHRWQMELVFVLSTVLMAAKNVHIL